MLLRTYGWMPCWRIVFSTSLRCMSFHTASVMNGHPAMSASRPFCPRQRTFIAAAALRGYCVVTVCCFSWGSLWFTAVRWNARKEEYSIDREIRSHAYSDVTQCTAAHLPNVPNFRFVVWCSIQLSYRP